METTVNKGFIVLSPLASGPIGFASKRPLLGSSRKPRDRLQPAAGARSDICFCNRTIGIPELMSVSSNEAELRALMLAGLSGDAAAHRALLERLSSQLRG